MADQSLPEAFSQLEPFVAQWALPDTNRRYAARLAASMEEMQAFNDAIVECAEDAKAYLDAKDFADYSDADRRLARLLLAFTVIGQSVQIYKQPAVPDTGAVKAFNVTHEPLI